MHEGNSVTHFDLNEIKHKFAVQRIKMRARNEARKVSILQRHWNGDDFDWTLRNALDVPVLSGNANVHQGEC